MSNNEPLLSVHKGIFQPGTASELIPGNVSSITMSPRRIRVREQVKLYNSNGDAVGTATSDSAGRVRFTRVPTGTYSIREISAPSGYFPSSITARAQITENDYATTARADPYSIANTRIDIPKTGDSATPWFWAGLSGLAIIGGITLLAFRKRVQ